MGPRVSFLDSSNTATSPWPQDEAQIADDSVASIASPDTPLADPHRGEKSEPEWHKVEKGETLWELSRRYQVPLALLRDINKHIVDAERMSIGTWVRIPLRTGRGAPPLAETVPADAPAGRTGTWLQEFSAQYGKTPQHITHANWHLLQVPNAEIAGKALWIPGHRPASAQAASLQAARPLPQQLAKPGATSAQRTPQQMTARPIAAQPIAAQPTMPHPAPVESIESTTAAAAEPAPQGNASAEDANLELRREAVALAWQAATAALDHVAPGLPSHAAGARDALRELDDATRGLDAEQAVQVIDAALPGIEAYDRAYRRIYARQPLNTDTMSTMLKVLGRAADSPHAPQLLKRYAQLGHWDEAAVNAAIADGAPPDYAFALAETGGMSAERVMQPVIARLQRINRRSAEIVGDWAQHDAKRVFMEPNLSGCMTQAIRHDALDDYASSMGATWQAERAKLLSLRNEQGQRFIEHKAMLLSSMARFPDLPKDSRARLERLMDDKFSNFAAQSAQEDPRIVRTLNWKALLARFYSDLSYVSTFKLSEQGRKFTGELAVGLVRNLFYKRLDMAALTRGDQALADELIKTLDGFTKSAWARVFGLEMADLNRAAEAMKNVIRRRMQMLTNGGYLKTLAGNELEAMTKFQKEMQKDIQAELGKLNGFHVSTLAGRAFRSIGWSLAGVSVYGAWSNAMARGTLQNVAKAFIETGGMVQKTIELGGVFNAWSLAQGSALERLGGAAASRVLTRLSVGHELWKAGDAFMHGNWKRGGLLLGYAGGQGLAAFGKFVPKNTLAGAVVAGASLAGLIALEGVERKLAHDPEHDGGVALRFLMRSGMKERVARAMLQPSSNGHCIVPLWVRYMELNGTDFDDEASQKKAIDWLNKMGERQLAGFCDDLLRTMDELHGDPSRLETTRLPPPSGQRHVSMSLWTSKDEKPALQSVEELNTALRELGISLPGSG